MRTLWTLTVLSLLAFGQAAGQTAATAAPENPSYILASGISFDAIGQQVSNVSTLAIKVGEIAGRPVYQQTTIETALLSFQDGQAVRAAQTAGTLRAGVCPTVYQTASRIISLGTCVDGGVVKAGNEVTLGTISGNGWLAWDVGAQLSKGRVHVFLIPTYRMVAISSTQVKPSYALRIGTGF